MNISTYWEPSWEEFNQKLIGKVRVAAYNSLLRGGYKVQGAAKLKLQPHVDRGYLWTSIVVIGDFSELSVKIGTNLGYARPMEFGSKPHWPPLKPIAEWAIRKGIPREAIGNIWYHIAHYGTKAHPYLIPSYEENIEAIKNDLIMSIARAL